MKHHTTPTHRDYIHEQEMYCLKHIIRSLHLRAVPLDGGWYRLLFDSQEDPEREAYRQETIRRAREDAG